MNTKYESFWTKNFILLIISNALLFMVFDMLVPTLPLFAQSIGCSTSQVGIVVGVFTLSSMFIRMFASSLMLILKKKYILLIGVLFCMLATTGYGFAVNLFTLVVFRLLHGLGHGVASTYFNTLALEELPPNRLGEGIGYFGVGETICTSVAPIIGIAILNKFNFNVLFTTGAAILLLSALMLLNTKDRSVTKAALLQNKLGKTPIKLIEKKVLPQCLLILLIGIVISGVMSYLAIFAKQQGIDNVAYFFFVAAISGVFIRVISGKIFDQKGPIFVLIPSGFCLIIGMLIIAFSKSEIMLNISGLFYGVAFGAIFPAVKAWVINKVDANNKEDAISSFFNFFDLGLGVGSFVLGAMIEATSYQSMYLISILFIIIYMILSVYYRKS